MGRAAGKDTRGGAVFRSDRRAKNRSPIGPFWVVLIFGLGPRIISDMRSLANGPLVNELQYYRGAARSCVVAVDAQTERLVFSCGAL